MLGLLLPSYVPWQEHWIRSGRAETGVSILIEGVGYLGYTFITVLDTFPLSVLYVLQTFLRLELCFFLVVLCRTYWINMQVITILSTLDILMDC